MSKSAKLGGQLALVCAGVLAACRQFRSADLSNADIARVKDVRSSFGPQFKVTEVGADGDRPATARTADTARRYEVRPGRLRDVRRPAQFRLAGVKGNMAATTAEGEGNRFITIAVETSEPIPVDRPADNCKKVCFAGGGVRGPVEVVAAPQIDGARPRPSTGSCRPRQRHAADRRDLQLPRELRNIPGDRDRQPAGDAGSSRSRRSTPSGPAICWPRPSPPSRVNGRRAGGTGC